MRVFRYFLYAVIAVPVILVLVWFLALPDDFIKNSIEEAISSHAEPGMDVSLDGFKKGILFTVYADGLELSINRIPAIRITGVKGKINPFYLIKNQFAFSIKGKIGSGEIDGYFKLPGNGDLTIRGAELSNIPYLTTAGLQGSGKVSADLSLKDDAVEVTFQIPDAEIKGAAMGVPLPINSFNKIQGALSIEGNTIQIRSINLEAEKGYARLKGNIINRDMNLSLEIMPVKEKLQPYETTLLKQYLVSPGYYLIPIKGPVSSAQ